MSKKHKEPPKKIMGFFPSREERNDIIEECSEFLGSFDNLLENDDDEDDDDWD